MDREDTALVVIDIQEKFVPVIPSIDEIISGAETIIRASVILQMPVIITEQYPKGLGKTVSPLASLVENRPIEKMGFSCFEEETFRKEMEKIDVKNLVLLGIEAHVCVLNTALDALGKGYAPHVLVDATGSRKEIDYETALRRMEREGITLTTVEIFLFQLLKKAGTPEFKAISKLIK